MGGLCIADPALGRRILSTHFHDALSAALAIDSALTTNAPISWVPNLSTEARGRDYSAEGEEDDGRAWQSGGGGGLAVCQIERNGLRYIIPVSNDVDPTLPLAFLHQLHLVLESYIGQPVTEASLKDNFDLVLELLEEMLSSGRPVLTEASQLKEIVELPSHLLTKVANVAGLTISNAQSTAAALLTSPLPWRRTGLKYNSNEIYFDITETLDFLLDKSGKVITGSVRGEVSCKSRLSGMPDLSLSFTDPTQLEDCSFHSSVRYGRWNKDKVVSFVPPDGTFTLMRFAFGGTSKSLLTGSTASLALLPLTIKPTITTGLLGSSFSFILTCRAPPSRPLRNLVLKFPLGKNASGVIGNISGGSYPREVGGKTIGGGAGRWDVEEDNVLVWRIKESCSTDRPAVLSGQFNSSNGSRPGAALTIEFDCPTGGFSGLRVAGLKLLNENYSIYKGVKITGRGKVEVRCI